MQFFKTAEQPARLGRLFFGIAVAAFGIQHLMYTGVLAGLELVPDHIPGHTFWAYLAGAVLVAGGLSIVADKKARSADLILGIGFLACTLIAVPQLAARPHDLGERTRVFEILALAGGAWILAGNSVPKLAITGRVFFALSLVIFGIDHLEVPAFIATLIPAWIPWHLFWAYFTALGFLAAGVSIALARWMHLAGLLLGLMFLLWVVFLHAPRVAAALHNADEWNSAFVALAMCGCALAAASAGLSQTAATPLKTAEEMQTSSRR